MKVSECMTQDVRIVDPGETLQDAARTMADNHARAVASPSSSAHRRRQ